MTIPPAAAPLSGPISGSSAGSLAPTLSIIIPTYNEAGNVEELVRRVGLAFPQTPWEVIFVDDNSPDGTMARVRALALREPRVRGLHRFGRRGLAGACIEGMLASSAPFVAVMDGDLQHDESALKGMLALLQTGTVDLVIGTRAPDAGDKTQAMGQVRAKGSDIANRLANAVLRTHVEDPMSGFFMMRRGVAEHYAPQLSTHGFKILFDLLASAHGQLRVDQVFYEFRTRHSGTSKLDRLVVLDYFSLLFSKLLGGRVPPRFLMFVLVGASGVVVNLATVLLLQGLLGFDVAQAVALVTSITSNYFLNNSLTYRNVRHRGWKILVGLASFALTCSVGAVVNFGVAKFAHDHGLAPVLASLSGAVVAALWNYVSSSTVTWRAS